MARELLEMVIATKDAVPIALAAFARHDTGEYETRATVERLSDLLQADDDAMRVFHYSFAEFLGITRSFPFFVNAALGAQRLADIATTPSAAEDIPPSLQAFCQRHIFDWITLSPNPLHYVKRLPQLYRIDLRHLSGTAALAQPAAAGVDR